MMIPVMNTTAIDSCMNAVYAFTTTCDCTATYLITYSRQIFTHMNKALIFQQQ